MKKKPWIVALKESGAVLAKKGWYHCFCDDTKYYTTAEKAFSAFKKRFPLSINLTKVVFVNTEKIANKNGEYSMDDVYDAVKTHPTF